jgi:iron complex transport system ATP-binding protein
LDIGYQPAVLDLIQKIRRDGKVTVVAAMHDLSLAAQYCTRIAALHQGGIHMVGEPADVMTPEVVATVFGAEISIVQHPVYGTPVVLPVSRV